MELISKYFYDPLTGFQSATKLYSKVKNIDPSISFANVQSFVKNQYVSQITKQRRKPKKYNPITALGSRDIYQMDLMIYDRFQFHNYKYILVVIDVYSRFCQCIALTTRQMPIILSNVKALFAKMGKPLNITCDNEFNTSLFNKYALEQRIHMHFTEPNEINKNAIVERVNRTIASMLQKWRQSSGQYEWYAILPAIMDNYNSTIHSNTGGSPCGWRMRRR